MLYHRLPKLFADLALARGDGRYPRLFRSLCRAQLLILDDWGPEPMTAPQRRDLLEILEDRYGRASTLVTSQIPIERWYDIVAEPTMADAILDRLVPQRPQDHLERRVDAKTRRQNGLTTSPTTELIQPSAKGPSRLSGFVESGGRLRSNRVSGFGRNPLSAFIGIRNRSPALTSAQISQIELWAGT